MAKQKYVCENCKFPVQKENGEIKRSKNLGRKIFCSRSCAASANNKTRISRGEKLGSTSGLISNNRADEFSPFRYFANKIRSRHKKKNLPDSKISLEDLKFLWEQQEGICPLTKWKMILPENTSIREKENVCPKSATLDKIDPKSPYEKGNIRYICYMANIAKNVFKDEDVIDFCLAVTINNTKI